MAGGFLGPGSGASRFSGSRGRAMGGVQGVAYPSPFFDIAHTYMPKTVKELLRWCRYYVLTNPVINATVFKLAEYPITDIVFDHPQPRVANKWQEYFYDHLNIQGFRKDCGLDFFAYGNSFPSVSFPFRKYLTCRGCRESFEARRTMS